MITDPLKVCIAARGFGAGGFTTDAHADFDAI
jgi:hypothetical protein